MPFEAKDDMEAPSAISLIDAMCAAGLLHENEKQNLEEILLKSGAALDQALSRLGLVTEEALADFYADYFSLPRCTRTSMEPSWRLIRRTNRRFLERHRIMPMEGTSEGVAAIIVDPEDQTGLEGLAFALNAEISPEIITASQFEQIHSSLFTENEATPDISNTASVSEDQAKLKDLASAEPAVRLVNRIIVNAANARASDIHIEPKERIVHVRQRIDGVLATTQTLTKAQGLTVVSRLKILAELDIAERRRPQDGRLSFPVAGRPVDMRVATTPTIHGESVVIRLLEKPVATLGLDTLGFAPSRASVLKRLIAQPNGILLVTGPTGSGKTTTLYSLLEMLAKRELKILTIEDPVEFRIDGVSQTQVNPAIGLDFANAMRSFLRHDPDVIMVGEMRDLETARTATQAALTGHLVLSTLHTNDAPSAITRLLDMGLEDYLVSSTLLGVVAQRLVRRACICKRAPHTGPCPACNDAGYAGRLAVSEILNVSEGIKQHLRNDVTASQLREAALADGFETMRMDGEAKVRAGLTDEAELIRVLGHEHVNS